MIYIIAGVSGSGKSTVGNLLATKLNVPFYDGDDYHPEVNKAKMKSGKPLNDDDRQPWLEALNKLLFDSEKERGAVLACSALKEKYRETLSANISSNIVWVFLKGSKELLQKRLQERPGHFFNPDLLDSQLQTIVYPSYGVLVDIENEPEKIVELIMEKGQTDIGLVGLGVMGSSLALNIADHGFGISVYNRVSEGEEKMVDDFMERVQSDHWVQGYKNLPDFVKSLKKPANILIMVKAGAAVDAVISSLLPHLSENDLMVDLGNSWFEDTSRRHDELKEKNITYLGVGVSGGEKGARFGPSIMPGGDQEAYGRVKEILEAISAKDEQGGDCCTYIGPEGSGHFVKMIHNGIEYGEMQILAEAWFVLSKGLKLSNLEISNVFDEWLTEGLESYLLEITIKILRKKEGDHDLVDLILDKAGQKGTGSWSSELAFRMGIPLNTISEAVLARQISAMKDYRVEMEKIYAEEGNPPPAITTQELKKAVELASVINHQIGFQMIYRTSEEKGWKVNLSELSRIWTNGCIIRSSLMQQLTGLFQSQNDILKNAKMISLVDNNIANLRKVVSESVLAGLPTPVLSTSIQYFTGITTGNLSANIIQAQRDFFGAHTYQRNDDPTGKPHHTNWP